jgi:REP element-mobilizing transposase RayT
MRVGRRLRWVPEEGSLVDITCRTVQGRRLLRPSPELNEIVLGVLGRAQRLHPIRICGVAVLSSHMHLLVDVDNAQQLSDFMEYACSNLAREVGRLTDWDGPVFAGRYHAIVVSPEEKAQVARLAYCLSQSCKEQLVERVRDWPGVHCVRALLDGEPLKGYWFGRSQEYAARRRGEDFERYDYATEETVEISKLPCWQHLSDKAYQKRVEGLVKEIEDEAAAERLRTGKPVLGVAAILAEDPQYRPVHLDRSPCPLFLVASEAMWRALYEAYAWFVAEFRAAAEKLRAGDRAAPFPRGSFPPALPFVGG